MEDSTGSPYLQSELLPQLNQQKGSFPSERLMASSAKHASEMLQELLDPEFTKDCEYVKATDSEGNTCIIQREVLAQQLLAA